MTTLEFVEQGTILRATVGSTVHGLRHVSVMRASRIRPMPRPRFSTAIATAVFFFAPRPGLPGATPPI
jgi:hypothetical protein